MTTPDCGTCDRRECPDHGQPHNMRTVLAKECEARTLEVGPDWTRLVFAPARRRGFGSGS